MDSVSSAPFSAFHPPAQVTRAPADSPSVAQVARAALQQLPPDLLELDFKEEPLAPTSFPDLVEPDQAEFTRRIPNQKMTEIRERVANLSLTPQMIEVFRNGVWSDEIFKTPGWADLAFKAYFEDQISCATFQKLLFYYACQDLTQFGEFDPPYEALQLFDGADFDERAKKIFFEAFFKTYPHTNEQLAAEKFKKFLELVQKIDPLKTQFFIASRNDHDPLLEVLVFRKRRDPVYIFGTVELDQAKKTVKQVICLPSIVNLIHKIFRGAQAKLGRPCLGFFRKEKLSDPIHRVVSIPCPLSISIHRRFTTTDWGLPDEIDRFRWQTPLSVFHHDAYFHVLMESQIPLPHREAFNGFAPFIQGRDDLDPNLKNAICFFLLDKNFSDYTQFEPNIAFWGALTAVAFDLSKDRTGQGADQFLSLIPQFFTPEKLDTLSIPLTSLANKRFFSTNPYIEPLRALYAQNS